MLLSLALAKVQAPVYEATLVPGPPDYRTLSEATVLEDGTVVANWYRWAAPGHGASWFTKPYRWDGKHSRALPLGKAEYGHVNYARGNWLVGDVQTEVGPRPAMWTPDPNLGWDKPILSVLDKDTGWAVWVSKTGKVWIASETAITSWDKGKIERTPVENFDLVAVSEDGKRYGNKYSYQSIGGSRMYQVAGFFLKGEWTPLPNGGASTAVIAAVSDSGLIVGYTVGEAWRAVSWSTEGIKVLAEGGKGVAMANAVSSAGHIVGIGSAPSPSSPFLWHDGKATDLLDSLQGGSPFRALSVNSKGQILVLAESRGPRVLGVEIANDLYLLTPKR